MTTCGTLLLRCDANVSIGTGHVMRCLALAQAWQDAGGCLVFAMAQSTPAVEERLRSENCKVIAIRSQSGSKDDAIETAQLAREMSSGWVVVDGYHFGSDYQLAVKQSASLLFVDDNGHAGSYCADLILNQNIHANAQIYERRSPQTRLLLGCRYALLRREFATWRDWRREIPESARRLLVTLGGSDPDNLTLRVLNAIPVSQGWDTTVIVGGSNPHLSDVKRWIAGRSADFHLATNVVDMPKQIARADLAIAGAGTTSWEMCALGLPALLLVAAENQVHVAEGLARLGAAENLGWGSQVTAIAIDERLKRLQTAKDVRERMSGAGQRLVDGLGAARVVALLQDEVRIRRSLQDDCRLFWQWANEPQTRAASFSSGFIPWDSHVQWFESKLADPNAMLYTAVDGSGAPLGYIRFQRCGHSAVISLSLDPQFRGLGRGRNLLLLACERVFADSFTTCIDAYVKPENRISLRLFAAAGFTRQGTATISDQPAIHFVLNKTLTP
jgi:UDP-2,4-diacetamido-2,4,6-trideoxy-beta-L-altropyranose hydrolase